LTVSESPITVKLRFGRVMATGLVVSQCKIIRHSGQARV
jgi:hypothetical protein